MRKFSGSSKSGAGRCGGRAALGATLKAPPPTQQQKSKYARALRDVCIECIGGEGEILARDDEFKFMMTSRPSQIKRQQIKRVGREVGTDVEAHLLYHNAASFFSSPF